MKQDKDIGKNINTQALFGLKVKTDLLAQAMLSEKT
jgi:hypothetical protein